MSGHRTGRQSDAGFTIVELVFSAAILLIVAVGVMGALTFATSASANTQVRDRAMTIANMRIEQARNRTYDNVGVVYTSGLHGDPDGNILTPESIAASGPVPTYVVDTVVKWIRDPVTERAMYKSVKVTVSWNTTLRKGSVSLSTLIYGKSALVNTGDYLARLSDVDTGERIANAVVTIDPSDGSANRTAPTDSGGEAFFGYVPVGNLAVTMASPQSGGQDMYLISAPSTAAVVYADRLTSQDWQAQKPSQAIVTVLKNSDSTAISGATVTITRTATGTSYSGTTDGTGRAVFNNLWAGAYTVAVSASSGFTPGSGALTIASGNSTGQTTIRLTGPASLVITAQESPGDALLTGASVYLFGPNSTTLAAGGSPMTSSATGTVLYTGLTPGRYYLNATASGHSASPQTYVDLVADTRSTATTVLPVNALGSLTITFNYWSSNKWKPKSGGRLQVYSSDNSYNNNNVTTNSSGQVTLSGLTPMLYYVKPLSPAGTTGSITVVGGSTVAITVTSP
jgi:type II secretory pathway pseudopilin PulG